MDGGCVPLVYTRQTRRQSSIDSLRFVLFLSLPFFPASLPLLGFVLLNKLSLSPTSFIIITDGDTFVGIQGRLPDVM